MIKALIEDLLVIVITEENVALMKAGDAIVIDLASMGNPKFTKIAIDFSPTMDEAMKKFSPYIGPETRIHGQEN